MKVTDKTIEMSLEEMDSELDSGSDLAEEIVSLVTNSFRPSFLDAGKNGQEGQFTLSSEEEQALLNGLIRSRASRKAT